jgi:tRNA (guanine37-N1)-methyltransferase
MRVDILTIFPEMFSGPLSTGLFQRAVDRGLVTVNLRNIRDYAHDRHRSVDDYPYGGGAGMVLKPEPIFEAVEAILDDIPEQDRAAIPIVMLTPQGRLFSQCIAREFSEYPRLILICGRYEGVDERVRQHLVNDELSIGDYVVGGGELPAMVVVDAVVRLLPEVLGSEDSVIEDSHTAGLLEHPQYTRPPVYRDWTVPEVLLSGNHERIAEWRREQSITRTLERRPELLEKAKLGHRDEQVVARLRQLH